MKSEESTRRMAESDFLTRDQFISLLLVADGQPIPAPIIPIDHEIRLIELGYIVNLQGLLRITPNGRIRTASIEAPDGQEKAAAGRRRRPLNGSQALVTAESSAKIAEAEICIS